MKNNKKLYVCLLIISIIAMIVCFITDVEGIVGYILFLFSLYIFFGSIIKICKISDRFKNNLINIVDILFWIP